MRIGKRETLPGIVRAEVRRAGAGASPAAAQPSTYAAPGVGGGASVPPVPVSDVAAAIAAHDADTGAHDIATRISAAINALLNGAPSALDTLKELADAIGDDASFASTITTALAGKASTSHTHDSSYAAKATQTEVENARGGYGNLNARINALSVAATIPGYLLEAGIGQATTLTGFDALTYHLACGVEFSQDGALRFRPQYPDGNTWTYRLSMVVQANGAQTAHFQTLRTLYYFRVYVDGVSAGNYDNGSGLHTLDVSLGSGERVVQILLTSDGSGDLALLLGNWLTGDITWVRAASS